jgi:hypothetical protein
MVNRNQQIESGEVAPSGAQKKPISLLVRI